jgi:hypothetical protein
MKSSLIADAMRILIRNTGFEIGTMKFSGRKAKTTLNPSAKILDMKHNIPV